MNRVENKMGQFNQLRVIQASGEKNFALSSDTLTLSAQADTHYQILNEHGALMIEPHARMVGQDLWVYADASANQPMLILKNYAVFSPITDTNTLIQFNATLATGASSGAMPIIPESTPILAQEVSTTTASPVITSSQTASTAGTSSSGFPTAAKIGLGVLALGGVAAAAAGGGGSGGNSSNQSATTAQNTPSPTIKFNAITTDNVVNRAESEQTITVSGQVQYAKQGDVVTLQVAGQTFTANVGQTGAFSVAISGAILAQATQLNAQVQTNASDGTTRTASATHIYAVDTEMATPVIVFNQLTGDNQLTATEASGQVLVSGRIQNVAVGDNVALTLSVGALKQTATVLSDGTFQASLDGDVLVDYRQIVAQATVQDKAGNQVSASQTLAYTIDANTFRPSIQLDSVTSDNIVTHAERSDNIVLSGKTRFVADGTVVHLNIGGQVVDAVVKDNAFSQTVSGEILAKNANIQASADVTHNGITETIVANHSYDVRATASYITINQIDTDNYIGAEQLHAMSRITGKLDISKLESKWQAQGVIRTITLNIGSQSYETALDKNFAFHVDIPVSELQTLAGQNITYQLNHLTELQIFGIKEQGMASIPITSSPNLKSVQLTLHSEAGILTQNNQNYAIAPANQLSQMLMVDVSGSVSGTAGQGDVVSLNVGQQTYTAVVQDNQQFTAQVSIADLKTDADKRISVSINGKDGQGEYAYAITPDSPSSDGNSQIKPSRLATNELPYFISAIDGVDLKRGKFDIGFLRNHQAGNALNVRYHFVNQDELNDLTNANLTVTERAIKHGFLWASANERLANLEASDPVVYSPENQDYIRQVLKTIAEYTRVTFTEVNSTRESDLDFYMMDTEVVSDGSAGFAYTGNDVHLNKNYYASMGQDLGSSNREGLRVAIHEILHTLGLKHPHLESDESSDVPALKDAQNSSGATIMSYEYDDFVHLDAPRLNDIAFLHYYYGVNPNARAGNDTYTFRTFNPATVDGDIYIWDGAGVDTFDASQEAQGVHVNLTAGSWIYADAKINSTDALGLISKEAENLADYLGNTTSASFKNYKVYTYDYTDKIAFIGYGTQLENLIGSAYDDVLIGNDANNTLTGGAGNDTLNGGIGNDYLDGGLGNDTLMGGLGDDIYITDGKDTITENSDAGNDTVYAFADFTLGDHLENLTLMGNASSGTGNSQNNIITGNQHSNTLTGGAGADQFTFSSVLNGNVDTITDFVVGEDTIALSKTIFTSLVDNMPNFADYIQYNSQTGALSYDSDGQGNGDAVQFATLQIGLDNLGAENFVLIA